ncbi:MAG: glycosyltransferase, partial [Bacteroidota bacterium]|nr:glycosyltransferase [Bacteroidota bacterium]
ASYKERIDKKIENAKLINPLFTVEFTGTLDENQLFEFYTKRPVSVFISLSSNEGLPVSMMEAISFGIPVFATDVGGCREICREGITGICVDPKLDDVALAKLFEKFYIKSIDYNREEVRRFWKENFSAGTNYSKLSTKLK